MGYFIHVRNMYFPVVNRCRADVKPEGKMTAFNLTDFASAFVWLGLGIGVSILTLILEIIFGRKVFKIFTRVM